MKFTIEVRSVDQRGAEHVARTIKIDAINPNRALRHARGLLIDWRKRRPATRVIVLNAQGEQLYDVTE